ncbi:related to potassium transporter TRK-1 [Cephalotrichum gorgonifer]|uniref:Related to potassium transporter TRK-1 n=1 Tax=Cephalotrichum gorgonifer TaxID=2041049 RepID=A0AAE8MZ19_9PEZI|nr:related to potassium transporter TRK-1 [Cephalotrichum gorgonifer]
MRNSHRSRFDGTGPASPLRTSVRSALGLSAAGCRAQTAKNYRRRQMMDNPPDRRLNTTRGEIIQTTEEKYFFDEREIQRLQIANAEWEDKYFQLEAQLGSERQHFKDQRALLDNLQADLEEQKRRLDEQQARWDDTIASMENVSLAEKEERRAIDKSREEATVFYGKLIAGCHALRRQRVRANNGQLSGGFIPKAASCKEKKPSPPKVGIAAPPSPYAWIISWSLLSLPVLLPYGNLEAIDALFFGASGCTESGLNTYDIKDLATYQQVYTYLGSIFTNLCFVNVIVVAVRLHWFEKRLKDESRRPAAGSGSYDIESGRDRNAERPEQPPDLNKHCQQLGTPPPPAADEGRTGNGPHIAFASDVDNHPRRDTTLYVPGPQDRDRVERDTTNTYGDDGDSIRPVSRTDGWRKRSNISLPPLSLAKSIENAASSFLAPGGISIDREPSRASDTPALASPRLRGLSKGVLVGRNSRLHNLTDEDRERLGGIEYRSLKILLKISAAYLIALHAFGVISLVSWIHKAPAKYTDYLEECGQDKTFWGFYSSQTMINNCGFTLTPDSMIHFNDATWPLIVMSFLAVTTWVLLGIISILNLIDILLIVILDLKNPAVNDLPLGPRILAAIYQSASSRHTGTSVFNLAEVNPGVQFSLVIMMYIAILPIAISIRSSNTYEERSLGRFSDDMHLNESRAGSYIMSHIRNQLAFDLWYIFLGTLVLCIAEADRIMDPDDPGFAIFPIFFEVVSGYGNVGLSIGHPSVATSLSGKFTAFSKLVMCFTMIRGRHRALPYALDRAVMLPNDSLREDGSSRDEDWEDLDLGHLTLPMQKYHTS